MRKTGIVAQVIQKRIVDGDHRLGGIPSERRLAEELGMSRTTVRTAVQKLVKDGLLVRQGNGRLDVGRRNPAKRVRTVGLVLPVGRSPDHDFWREAVEQSLEGYDVALRPVTYTHWGDPFIADAIGGFDGLFFIPRADDAPAWLTSKLANAGIRVVMLDEDWSTAGLPSIVMFPPKAETKLLDHLIELGHRRIDCLNVQPENQIILGRIGVWREYLEKQIITGQFLSRHGGAPVETAYRLMQEELLAGRIKASAVICTTGMAAIGAMRAIEEAKLEVGRDISVCAVNDEGLGRYLHKSLTALENPSRVKYLRKAVQWMLGDKSWEGPLLVQPADAPMFIGESTGAARIE